MDALKSAVLETRASFDIQNDLKLLDNIGSNLQHLNSLQSSDLKEKRGEINGKLLSNGLKLNNKE